RSREEGRQGLLPREGGEGKSRPRDGATRPVPPPGETDDPARSEVRGRRRLRILRGLVEGVLRRRAPSQRPEGRCHRGSQPGARPCPEVLRGSPGKSLGAPEDPPSTVTSCAPMTRPPLGGRRGIPAPRERLHGGAFRGPVLHAPRRAPRQPALLDRAGVLLHRRRLPRRVRGHLRGLPDLEESRPTGEGPDPDRIGSRFFHAAVVRPREPPPRRILASRERATRDPGGCTGHRRAIPLGPEAVALSTQTPGVPPPGT